MDEMPLVQAQDIREIWGVELQAVGCLDCGGVHLVTPDRELPRCPACLAENLASQPALLRAEPPEQFIPFSQSLAPVHLTPNLRRWLRGIWLRPSDLGVERLLERLTRVYLPMWLVDGQVEGNWMALMGFDYQVESSQERFVEDQGWTSQRLTETRVRWEQRAGRLSRRYDNLAVPALEEQEQATLTTRAGDYELDKAVTYTPAAVADVAVRVPSLLPEQAWPLARAALDRRAVADCRRAASAQHSKEFALEAEYHDLNWTQLLLPLYVTYYADDVGRVVPVWINGQSGRIGGVRRASLRKGWRLGIGIGGMAVLVFTCGLLLLLLDVTVVASALMSMGFFGGLLALLPLFWAWQFNQRHAA